MLCRSLSQSFTVYILPNKSQPCRVGDLCWHCKCWKARETLLQIKGARLACFCLQKDSVCRVEVRLVCHLYASHPAPPSFSSPGSVCPVVAFSTVMQELVGCRQECPSPI